MARTLFIYKNYKIKKRWNVMDEIEKKADKNKFEDKKIGRFLFCQAYKESLLVTIIFKSLVVDFRAAEVIMCVLCIVYAVLSFYFLKNAIDFRYDKEQEWESYQSELKFIIVVCLTLVIYIIAV